MVREYPEAQKFAKVADKSQAISEFLGWCADEKGIHLVSLDDHHVDGVPVSPRPLINEFFGIDEKALEQERRDMLDQMRATFNEDEG